MAELKNIFISKNLFMGKSAWTNPYRDFILGQKSHHHLRPIVLMCNEIVT